MRRAHEAAMDKKDKLFKAVKEDMKRVELARNEKILRLTTKHTHETKGLQAKLDVALLELETLRNETAAEKPLSKDAQSLRELEDRYKEALQQKDKTLRTSEASKGQEIAQVQLAHSLNINTRRASSAQLLLNAKA